MGKMGIPTEEIKAALKSGADTVLADLQAGTALRHELADLLCRFSKLNDRTVCVNLLAYASALAQLNDIPGAAFHTLAGIVDVMVRETDAANKAEAGHGTTEG